MPKRGSRSSRGRGGSGRGGASGGARGGGSFRSYNLSKSSKRRANKNRMAAHANQDMPELMDLGADSYLPEVGSKMNSLSKRPNRRMIAEAQYTDKHLEETMSQPLRYRRIEFVKAKEVYDPGRDLMDSLKKYEKNDELAQDLQKLNVEADDDTPLVADKTPVEAQSDTESSQSQLSADVNVITGDAIIQTCDDVRSKSAPVVTLNPMINVEVDEKDNSEDGSRFLLDNCEGPQRNDTLPGQVFESEETLQSEIAPEIRPVVEEEIPHENVASELVTVPILTEHDKSDGESTELPASALSEFFTIDETGDDELLEKHAVKKQSTAALLNRPRSVKLDIVPPVPSKANDVATEHDPYLMVGKVMLKTRMDKAGNLCTSLPQSGGHKKVSLTDDDFSDSYFEEMSDDTDEDAAFEDYKAQIMGDFDFHNDFGDNDIAEEFADLDGRESFDYGDFDLGSNSNGECGIDPNDIYISSDESADDGDLNSEEEGLEDILSFARKQQKVKDLFDSAPTQTVKKSGKGRKQRLELGSHLELELRESLMEQFQYQKQSKKDKKLRKKEKRQREGIELHDLCVKYDYSLHIQEIRQEFETFLHDAGRETMSFPPLDGHGNKTIHKLAGHYNMKCIRCGGNGLNLFMKVAKTKKTFRYIPAYDQIGFITKQRPVFKRVDVKPRTQEEIQQSDGKKERRGPKSDAVVREGDIVGGKAPEIGNNNIGRQLLEKLGWIKGEGLGAMGNKGISEPLTATVKRSKTGLK